jgi:UDP-glucose 4-epimerase
LRTCVIGGAGFIGVHVTELLVASGREVVVLGRREQPARTLPTQAKYVAGDYGNLALLREVLPGTDEVIDLAYATVPQTSFADPVFDILSNLPSSVRLLQEAASARVQKVVVVSSGGTVYGIATSLPIREDHPTNPISPYGITKLTVEKYANLFQRVSDLPVMVLRPGNAYGEDQRAFAGQGFIATAMHSIMRGQEISVFGEEGTVRDYIHVSDVARGIVAAMDRGETGQVYNIGSGIGRSNADILKLIEPLACQAGYELLVKALPSRKFDVPVNVLDSRKLEQISGWAPLVTFEAGVRRVWTELMRRSAL